MLGINFISGVRLILTACLLSSISQASLIPSNPLGARGLKPYPRRTLGGVSVVDTPIVRAAEAFARQNGQDFTYKHIMRSWLFGALVIQHNETLRATIDLEVHAVAALLHDLGWDQTDGSPMVSADRRFEVDGAIAARNFIRDHRDGKRWEERRVQLVWDAIALHTQQSIALFKELDVQVVHKGIITDFDGPQLGITKDEYAAVVKEFPRDDLRDGLNETVIWLCSTKPASTYDTWMQPWGEAYVANYSAVGSRLFDRPTY
ncbi:hypothetical protein CHGG_08317 [Chaetomium globosum CBS 148.51]|uniref:HD domain-containing protein n=1 Tax=Chaetomium globosum (strain ATCC 6205 / CBS 148.51 / DSM 1962 / NBRC 6347 / NRRL 1970) TaxID=306901 RepID=Q2GUN7_CHAGB|nr:uncharacterized protein CHGG_08317 [Chaetomium globosum CBS 148.51]EAQ87064.1 hypothetical protein CHGG_08317 [Chaetomium globosum CBS 148.51]